MLESAKVRSLRVLKTSLTQRSATGNVGKGNKKTG
jgi:hypothetical protein